MVQLPDFVLSNYRPATTRDVHSWSFGALQVVRPVGGGDWKANLGTLNDERIFGPLKDFECACGRYGGRQYEGMICDRCGVKLTTTSSRRRRFGHIELAVAIGHPFDPSIQLKAVPVLPAVFVGSQAGYKLADLYEGIIRASDDPDPDPIASAFNAVVEYLAPGLTEAHSWSLEDAPVLARGAALAAREADEDEGCDPLCPVCGYVLAGLKGKLCPGCGNLLL